MEYAKQYVDKIIGDILKEDVKDVSCYICKKKRYRTSIYCENHERELDKCVRLKLIRKNNKILLMDINGNLYENDGKTIKNLKKTSNIDLYKMPAKKTAKPKTKSSTKSKGKTKASKSKGKKSTTKQCGGEPVAASTPASTPAPTTGGGKTNPWMAHVAAFRAANPTLSYKQCLVGAKATYKKV